MARRNFPKNYRRRGRSRRPYSRRPGQAPAPLSFWAKISAYFSKPRPRQQLKTPQRVLEVGVGSAEVAGSSDSALEFAPSLFFKFPELAEKIPWLSLRGSLEVSPPSKSMHIQHLFGDNHIFLKREKLDADHIVENQAKKMEFSLAAALKAKKRLVGFGYTGSAYIWSLAQIARMFGAKLELCLLNRPMGELEKDRQKDIQKWVSAVRICSSESSYELRRKWMSYKSAWTKAQFLDFEGINSEAVLGYISSMGELRDQVDRGLIPSPDLIVIPVESGVSLAGLEIGRRIYEFQKIDILGIRTRKFYHMDRDRLANLANGAIEILNRHLNQNLKFSFKPESFNILEDYSQDAGQLDQLKVDRWRHRLMDLDALEFDPMNNARAFLALSEYVNSKPISQKKILYWNTSSALGSLSVELKPKKTLIRRRA
ncbi:MAG: hypothetical protein COV44_08790 [Deltaproteobacteria bacterium CG11_big_fil_rev_8_21_14_0_20_45_16]|nr:MAG: hypothetical protein COV44_08790 [Deltaproteobacteria bacterium CG11_big_fil_rev_8_21_14_0_20_45_16]